jgi:hypothetical protein
MKIQVAQAAWGGGCEYHRVGCAHNKGFDDPYEIEVSASNMKELCRELTLDVNHDFAADHGMTVDQYLEEIGGYEVGTARHLEHRVMPCVKF